MKQFFGQLTVSLLFLMLAAGIFLSGCAVPGKGPENVNGGTSPGDKPAEPDVIVNYELIEEKDLEETLPLEIRTHIAALRKHKGYFVFPPQDEETGDVVYLMVSAGEKPTGGYALVLDSLEILNGVIHLQVNEKAPGKDDLVIQVLTYPVLVFKFDQKYDSYKVSGPDKQPYPSLSSDLLPRHIETEGVYNGQIDNNFIEISVGNMAGAYMLPRDLAWVLTEVLKEGDKVVFTYLENEHGQRILLKIDKA